MIDAKLEQTKLINDVLLSTEKKLPDGWVVKRLGEVVDISSSKRVFAKEYINNGVPFYRGKEIVEKQLNNKVSTKIFISKARFLEIKSKFGAPSLGDMLLTSVGTVGIPYVVKAQEEFYFKDGNLTWFKNWRGLYNIYFYYWVLSGIGKNAIKNITIGSTQQAITINSLGNINLLLPLLSEQKQIAKVLSSLDDKIECNQQINTKLEEMAQAIFKQWFIDFNFPDEQGNPYKDSGGVMVESELGLIPEGWNVGKLGDVILQVKEIIKSIDAKNKIYIPIDKLEPKKLLAHGFLSGREAKSGLIEFKSGDILLGAKRVYFHRVNLATMPGVTRTTTFVLRSIDQNEMCYNLLLLNQDETISFASQTSKGSTMPYAVWENGLVNYQIINSFPELKVKFNQIIKPMIERIAQNNINCNSLVALRDALLPKLMSGEIRVV